MLEVHRARRRQAFEVVGASRAHVGEFLFFGRVDVHVVTTRVFADDHAFVYFNTRPHEQRAAFLQVHQCVTGGNADTIGNQAAVGTSTNFAKPGRPTVEDVVDDSRSSRFCEELGAEPNEPTGRNEVFKANPARAMVDHLFHATFSQCEQLRDDTEEVFRHVDADALDRLVHLAVDFAGHDAGFADRELEAFAAHHLNEDRELELATPLYFPLVRTINIDDPQTHVADELLVESCLHQTSRELLAVFSGQR